MKSIIASIAVLLLASQVQAAPGTNFNTANGFDYFAYQTTVSN